jgi:hypothetical protein
MSRGRGSNVRSILFVDVRLIAEQAPLNRPTTAFSPSNTTFDRTKPDAADLPGDAALDVAMPVDAHKGFRASQNIIPYHDRRVSTPCYDSRLSGYLPNEKAKEQLLSRAYDIGIAEGGARTHDLEVDLFAVIRATRSTN